MVGNLKQYFQILATSGVPIYRQLTDQVKFNIAAGKLEPGAFLPSVRQVASELAINPMTVSKAYSILVKEGVIEFVRGQGMAVAAAKKETKEHVKQQKNLLKPVMKHLVKQAKQLSFSKEEVIAEFEHLWEGAENE